MKCCIETRNDSVITQTSSQAACAGLASDVVIATTEN